MKDNFIPRSLADLDTWEVNFKEKVYPIIQELKMGNDEATEAIALLEAHRANYAIMMDKRAEAKAATSTNSEAQKAAVAAYRSLAKRIKSAKKYTGAMGNSLRIIGTDSVFEKAVAKPLLAIGKEGNHVVVKFIKDRADGVHIYCRRGGEAGFSFLAVDTTSPYNDSRANLVPGQSEQREYKAWYFVDDAIIGQESDVVSIVL